MDPQTLRLRGDGRYDQSCDFYSYCCLAYEVLSGEWLPRITKLITLMKMEVNRRPHFPRIIPIELRTILFSGFEEDRDKRASWDVVLRVLRKILPDKEVFRAEESTLVTGKDNPKIDDQCEIVDAPIKVEKKKDKQKQRKWTKNDIGVFLFVIKYFCVSKYRFKTFISLGSPTNFVHLGGVSLSRPKPPMSDTRMRRRSSNPQPNTKDETQTPVPTNSNFRKSMPAPSSQPLLIVDPDTQEAINPQPNAKYSSTTYTTTLTVATNKMQSQSQLATSPPSADTNITSSAFQTNTSITDNISACKDADDKTT